MRKITYLYVLLLFVPTNFLLAQHSSQRFLASASGDATQTTELEKYYREFQLVTLPFEEIDLLVHSTSTPQMQWVFPNGMYWDVALEAAPIHAGNFSIKMFTRTGEREVLVDTERINTFRAGKAGLDIRMTINQDFIYGYYQEEGGALWYIEPANRFAPTAAPNQYVVYRSEDVLPVAGLQCGQTEMAHTETVPGGGRGGCVELDIAVATDYSIYEEYGTPGGILNRITGITNNVNGNYEEDFASTVSIRISELYISACPTCDPWYDGVEALDLLESFRDWSIADGFENHYDVGQFWSQRNYRSGTSGAVIGMAFLGGACSNNNYHILEDFTNSAGYLRVMMAHEIGHNLGCSHNFEHWDPTCFMGGRPDHIMDPSVSLANVWSDGQGYNCEGDSKGTINNFLAANTCLSSCGTHCAMVEGLVADFDESAPALSLNWTADAASEWEIIVHDLNSKMIDTFYVNETALVLTEAIDLCSSYEVMVRAICTDGGNSAPQRIRLNTEASTAMKLESLQIDNCELTDQLYDLNLVVAYEETFAEGFTVQVGEEAFPFPYTNSPQTVIIENLRAEGWERMEVVVLNNYNQRIGCAAKGSYYTPNEQCTWKKTYDFNDCQLPIGWRTASTYAGANQWQMGDSTRQVLNFGTTQNTFDGSCMLYFDDDMLGPDPMYSGTAHIYTTVEKLADYAVIEMSLMYNFNAFYTQPYTNFKIDVFNGQNWVNILTDNSTSGCSPGDAFLAECHTTFEVDLSSYANDDFQIRFSYFDGGYWGEFVAMDNFELRAARSASSLPVELVDFQAQKMGEQAKLSWETALEINNAGFVIERSVDGRSFAKIGYVVGAGDSDTPQFYDYVDTHPVSGINYYRLRQEDTDGQYSYSPIRELYFDAKDQRWQVFPNPAHSGQTVNLRWQQLNYEDLTLSVFSTSGQRVIQDTWTQAPGLAERTLQLTNLSVGMYLLQLSNGWQERVVVVR